MPFTCEHVHMMKTYVFVLSYVHPGSLTMSKGAETGTCVSDRYDGVCGIICMYLLCLYKKLMYYELALTQSVSKICI